MFLREIITEEVTEGVVSIYGKTGNKTVRKYRCTSGSRKGRIVAQPSTCTAPRNVKASRTLKTTKRQKGAAMSVKTKRTKKSNPKSLKLKLHNVGRRSGRKKSKGKRI
jgi:hypothetical protein